MRPTSARSTGDGGDISGGAAGGSRVVAPFTVNRLRNPHLGGVATVRILSRNLMVRDCLIKARRQKLASRRCKPTLRLPNMHSTSLTAVALSALALFAALNGNAALAATQGSQGATSAGSIAITLSVAGRVQISGLSDVSFVSVSPDVAAVSAQNVCVWSNTATKGYSLSASGSGAGSAFELAGTSGSVT